MFIRLMHDLSNEVQVPPTNTAEGNPDNEKLPQENKFWQI